MLVFTIDSSGMRSFAVISKSSEGELSLCCSDSVKFSWDWIRLLVVFASSFGEQVVS